MTAKFLYRTFRQAVVGGRPYFAHLALTHRCNLRCRFCQITSSPYPELDLDDMKRVIDRLDRMGVAVLSLTGGEPLLRPDFAAIIDYAAAKGLQVVVATNGTMPRAKYTELIRSRVSEIGMSLDGVRGSDIPYSHTGPGILGNIKFVNDNLPPGKRLRINITISEANYDEVQNIVRYCTAAFPNARLWLNPVVVGAGRLRTSTERRVPADYLSRVDSPLVLLPGFYKRACEAYSETGRYDWGCRAGERFLDIKPNGGLWICQDHPCLERLNILDPDFELRYRHADFSNRRHCGGCTYSCYLMAQLAFDPRNWADVARLWWAISTRPGEACRNTADRLGWVAGLLHFAWLRLGARRFRRQRIRPRQDRAGDEAKLMPDPPLTVPQGSG